MKQVIYADVLIVLNTALTFLLLLATSRLTKLFPVAWRYVAGSLLGGISSLIVFAPDMGLFLSLLIKLLFSLIIVSATYNPKTLRVVVRQTAYFFVASFLFAGIMLFVSSLPQISLISYNNGVVYVDLSLFSLIAAAVLCYVTARILNRLTRSHLQSQLLYNIQILNNGKNVSRSAVLDTGNSLCDPFTGESLIIVCKNDINNLLPDNVRNYLNGEPEMCTQIRLVPCATIDSQSLLPVFRVEKVKITSTDVCVELEDVPIAVCTNSIENVILPPNILYNSERGKKDAKTVN